MRMTSRVQPLYGEAKIRLFIKGPTGRLAVLSRGGYCRKPNVDKLPVLHIRRDAFENFVLRGECRKFSVDLKPFVDEFQLLHFLFCS